MNSMSDIRDSDESARTGLLRSTGGIPPVYRPNALQSRDSYHHRMGGSAPEGGSRPGKPAPYCAPMPGFTDEASVCVIGGNGGAGAVSFRREAHVPRGGPDGGDGGKGGDVWLVADPEVASLAAFRDHPHRRAASGTHGQGRARHGTAGADLRVP